MAVAPFRPRKAALPRVSIVVALLALVAACSGTSADPGSTTGPGSDASPAVPSTGATSSGVDPGAPTAGPCAWPTRADKATLNIAYPDTAATYWTLSYRLAPGEHLELRGRYPSARYLSFITYGPSGGAVATLTDRDIQPDPGSTNPFQGVGSAGGRYTVQVRSDGDARANAVSAVRPATEGGPGSVPATSPATAPSTSGTVPAPAPAEDPANLLGSGAKGGEGVVAGTVIYRVYLPGTAGDATGGGGLPAVRVLHPDGTATEVPPCPTQGANPAAEAIVRANGPKSFSPAPAQPVFLRPAAGAANLYPNPDNVYIVTILHHTPGQVVVVRGRAPMFPDTGAGQAITGTEQVRYWSLCSDEYRSPFPVSSCVADQDVALDAEDRYTFVVSTPEDRPANATAANGVTWLDWGSTEVDNLLLMRHMLAAPGFAESAIRLRPGSLASTQMGAYTPVGVYCAAEAFRTGGAAACPAA